MLKLTIIKLKLNQISQLLLKLCKFGQINFLSNISTKLLILISFVIIK
jgi:hypothetical protein